MKGKKISFIGGGKMGEALIRGMLEAKIVGIDQITVSDVISERRDYLGKTYGIAVTNDNIKAVETGDIIILAVKPQVISKVLEEISQAVDKNKLLISIAAGIGIEILEAHLGEERRIIRVMPNTPAQVREGMTAISPNNHALPEDIETAKEIFGAVGKVVRMEEKLMDVVTALGGSGPAYVCLFVEALANGGVKMGLSAKDAYQIATQTVLGTAKMILETGKHPAQLKDEVTSPGGTTIEGLSVLESKGVRGALIKTVEAATKRSKKLGKEVAKASAKKLEEPEKKKA